MNAWHILGTAFLIETVLTEREFEARLALLSMHGVEPAIVSGQFCLDGGNRTAPDGFGDREERPRVWPKEEELLWRVEIARFERAPAGKALDSSGRTQR